MRTLLTLMWLATVMMSQALASTIVKCPMTYPKPEGWVVNAMASRLTPRSAGVVVGQPVGEVQARQIPSSETKTKEGIKMEFQDLDKFVEPLAKWVYCSYGPDDSIQLLKRVPDNVRTCTADVRKDSIEMACQ